MGVAQYQLSHALPPQLAADLPTVEEFEREFPLMSVVKLRIEIERSLRDLAVVKGVAANRPVGIMNMLRDLQRHGIAPASTQEMLRALRVMNEASHGVDADAAKQAVDIGTVFLAELREIGTGD